MADEPDTLTRAQRRQRDRARTELLESMRKGMWPTNRMLMAACSPKLEEAVMDDLTVGRRTLLGIVANMVEDAFAKEYREEIEKRTATVPIVRSGGLAE